jgi:hypothetical protein
MWPKCERQKAKYVMVAAARSERHSHLKGEELFGDQSTIFNDIFNEKTK